MSKMRINMLLLMILVGISFFSCQNGKNTSTFKSSTKDSIRKTERMPIGPKLAENNHLSIEDRIELYHRLKIESPDAYTFDNLDDITMYGYSLLWNNLGFFEQFIDSCFVEINKKRIENLIIDVRYNGGGSPHASIHLLKYLIDEPFVYYASTPNGMDEELQYPFDRQFEGNLFFLIDGNGNSTTGHFMSIAKDLKLGTIIGEELGSNQFCTAGQTIRRLSNTGLEYYIPNSTCISSATSLSDDRGVLPDHYIAQSIDDYLNGIDRVKEYAIELIDE